MDDLLKLAERCEQAAGPDRAIDDAIWFDVLGNCLHETKLVERDVSLNADWQEIDLIQQCSKCGTFNLGRPFRRYTASLDAAMTLVPEGCGILLNEPGSYVGNPWAHINLPRQGPIPRPIKAEAVTLPLAICDASEQVGS
jgi:hypothetical protein